MKALRSLGRFGLFCGLLAGSLYVSPYVSIFLISRAVASKDYGSAIRYLDPPSIRDSFKQQMAEYLKYSSKADGISGGAWGQLYKGIGGAMSELVVQSAISDDAIKKLLETGQSPLPADGDAETIDFGSLLNGAKYSYVSFDQFKVNLSGAPSWFPDELMLQRHNLFTWKIASIRLNLDASANATGSASGKISCGKAIGRVEDEIRAWTKSSAIVTQKSDIDSPFPGRSSLYSFVIKVPDGSDGTNGEKLISDFLDNQSALEWSSRVVTDSCSDVATVKFGMYATGYWIGYYYTDSGLMKGQCVDPGQNVLRWGQHYCT